VGPNRLVSTLLVFGVLPRIIYDSPPIPSSIKRAEAIHKAIIELRKLVAKKKVTEALNIRNNLNIIAILPHSLTIGSEVRVYRKKNRWTGSFKILSVTDNEVIIDSINKF
jgi:hypothetical protein